MTKPVRLALKVLAAIASVFAGLMLRDWHDEILTSFPFYFGIGPISWRACAFWGVLFVAMGPPPGTTLINGARTARKKEKRPFMPAPSS